MDAARLNERITVQCAETTADDIGNHKSEWRDVYHCFALVTNTGGQETDAAGQTVDHADATFLLRWCRTAAAVGCKTHRIVFRGGIYDILSIDYLNYKQQYIKLKGKKVER